MKKIVSLLFIVLLLSITSYAQAKIDISLKNGSPGEIQTRDQLQRLLTTSDLSKWIFTKSILIDEKAIPHSHPILTLHTRHVKDGFASKVLSDAKRCALSFTPRL